MPPALKQLQHLLTKGLHSTATLWSPLQRAYKLVHQAKEILANQEQHPGTQVRERYLAFVRQMQEQKADMGPLGEAIEHFCHITDNFAVGLFHCYDVEGLPRTNNDLEHCFGVARVHERRATGRRGAIPGVVVRGSVRVITAVAPVSRASRPRSFDPAIISAGATCVPTCSSVRKPVGSSSASAKIRLAYLAALEAQLLT